MASTRLTTTLRGEILAAAMKGAYDNVKAQIDDKMIEFSERVYRSLVTEEQERAMGRLPHGFFNLSDTKSARIYPSDGTSSRRYTGLKFKKERRLPAFCSGYNDVTINDDAIHAAYLAIEKEYDALKEKREELRVQIAGVLESVNTVQKLLEVWPEAEPFIPEYVFVKKAALPALVTDALNDLLKQARPELAVAA